MLSLLFVWPVRIAMFGKDAFRSGGSDHGAAEDVFRGFDVGLFALWAIVLLVDRRPHAERLELATHPRRRSPSPGSCSC